MQTITFEQVKDINLAHTFECGQCFRWNPIGEDYLGVVGDYACRAHLEDDVLTLQVSGGDEAFWRNYFDLDTDYGAIKSILISQEPRIEKAIESGYGIRILRQNCFEALISFIVSQNNNIPRIKKCIEGLCESFGHRIDFPCEGSLYSFPTAGTLAAASVEDLAMLKLGYRDRYIIEAGKRFVEEGEPCRESISSYLGVGPKVANCIKLFGMRCVDAFPIDVWVRRIMADMYGFEENDVKGMQKFAEEKYGELGGYAQQYLFHYYRNVKL